MLRTPGCSPDSTTGFLAMHVGSTPTRTILVPAALLLATARGECSSVGALSPRPATTCRRAGEAGQLAESLARLMPASLDAAQHQSIREEVLRQVVTGGPIARIEAHLDALGRSAGAGRGQAPACGVLRTPLQRDVVVDAQLADCFRRTPLHLAVTTTIDSWCAPQQARVSEHRLVTCKQP
jgi:hypothetical protein